MRLPSTLAWLVDEASAAAGADHFLAALGAQLIADGLPLAGGALMVAAPHPIIARRTWLWQAETGGGVEGLGFGGFGSARPRQGGVRGGWVTRVGGAIVGGDFPGPGA